MKVTLLLIAIAMLAVGCGNSQQKVADPAQESNVDADLRKNDGSLTVSSHGQSPPGTIEPGPEGDKSSGSKSKWTQSGDPIDTSSYDLKIVAAEKELKAKSNDDAAKKRLSVAFYERGTALKDARQYASALGDYRRAMKYDPGNKDAANWIEQIVEIYQSLNKASPPEGEEPPPLEFKKGT